MVFTTEIKNIAEFASSEIFEPIGDFVEVCLDHIKEGLIGLILLAISVNPSNFSHAICSPVFDIPNMEAVTTGVAEKTVGDLTFELPYFNPLELENIQSFESQFSKFAESYPKEAPEFRNAYDLISGAVSGLEILDVFIDFSLWQSWVDFNICLPKGFFISVAKGIYDTECADLMFSISKDNELLEMHTAPINDFKDIISAILS